MCLKFLYFPVFCVLILKSTAAAKVDNSLEIFKNYEDDCGVPFFVKNLTGNEVRKFQFPWMAVLVNNENGLQIKCAGSLITERHILTAAHCFTGPVKPKEVLLGVHNISLDHDCDYEYHSIKCYNVERFIIAKHVKHPGYNGLKKRNDIAVVTLNQDVKFHPHIRPICLPTTKQSKRHNKNGEYINAGWGYTENNTQIDVILKTTVQNLDNCKVIFKKDYNLNKISDKMCTKGHTLQDGCLAEDGRPLFQFGPYDNDNRYVQYGVASFGSSLCHQQESIMFYTKVIEFIDWIAKEISKID